MSTFYSDLKEGQKTENIIYYLLKKNNHNIQKNTSNDYQTLKEYDLILNNSIKIEVKYDKMASITGNLALEYNCSNKLSGILSTKSQIWVYRIKNQLLFFNTKDLKHAFNSKQYFRTVNGGDSNRAKLALFKLNEIKQYAKRIIDIPKVLL